MMGIIVGKNRVEYITVKKKDLKKHFFVTRDQLYKFYPNELEKAYLEDDKGIVRTESVIIFPELSIRPFGWEPPSEGDTDPFAFDTILANLDDHKRLRGRNPFSKWRMYLTSGRSIWRELSPAVPIIIVGVVLLLAFTGVLH